MASKYAVVDKVNRRIENFILAEPGFVLEDKDLVPLTSIPQAIIGGTLVNGVFVPEPPHVDTPLEVNAKLIQTQLADGLANMQQIIDTPAPFNAAQSTTAIKAQARLLRGVLRYIRADYSGSE